MAASLSSFSSLAARPPGTWPGPPPVVAAGLGLTGWVRRRRRALTAGLGLLALLWPAGVAAQTAVEYYHLDAVGTVRAVTNASGQVVRRHDVTPFGEEVSPTVPNPDRQLFTGHERDAETSLDYFGARYYRAQVGRFTTVDPVYTWSENLVDPQRWNRYSHVRNNPLRFTDPDGRCVYPGADCGQFLLGAVKAVANIVPDSISLLNAATNLVIAPATDFRFSALPRFEAANEDQRRGMFSANFMMLAAPVAELAGAETAAAGGTELVQRAMSRTELSATEATGLVRGGRPGTHYVSDAVNSGAHRAQQRLALPQAPQIRVTLEVPTGAFSNSTKVPPAYGMPGGGLQRTASGKIPAVVRKVEEMK